MFDPGRRAGRGAGRRRPRPGAPAQSAASKSRFVEDPYPSTYRAIASGPVLIEHATVLTGTGQRLDNADVLLQDGKVVAVGSALQAPADATRVDGNGKWVTPGIIDVHSHLGVYPSPGVSAHSDGNEMTGAGHRQRLGRAFDLAAGSGLRRPRSPAASPRCRSCPARPTWSAAAA